MWEVKAHRGWSLSRNVYVCRAGLCVAQLVVRGMADAAAAGGSDPYKVLEVPPETESDRVMFAYNKLVRPHPSTLLHWHTTRPAPLASRRIPPALRRGPHVVAFALW